MMKVPAYVDALVGVTAFDLISRRKVVRTTNIVVAVAAGLGMYTYAPGSIGVRELICTAPGGGEMKSSDEWEFRFSKRTRDVARSLLGRLPWTRSSTEPFGSSVPSRCPRGAPPVVFIDAPSGMTSSIPVRESARHGPSQICDEPVLPRASEKGTRWKHETDQFIDTVKADGQGHGLESLRAQVKRGEGIGGRCRGFEGYLGRAATYRQFAEQMGETIPPVQAKAPAQIANQSKSVPQALGTSPPIQSPAIVTQPAAPPRAQCAGRLMGGATNPPTQTGVPGTRVDMARIRGAGRRGRAQPLQGQIRRLCIGEEWNKVLSSD